MRIYEVWFPCEGARDGYFRSYHTSAAKARKEVARINREHKEAVQKRKAAEEADVSFYDLPVDPGAAPDPEITSIDLTGSCRDMVLQALRWNA